MVFSQSSEHHRTLWERACSRRGRHIQHEYRLTHRLRRQAGLAPIFGELRAPTECTVNRNRAHQPIQNPACIRNRTPIEKTRKPRMTGLSAFQSGFLYQLVKTWHAPCNSPFSDSVHYPVLGTLVQAGRGFPSFTSGSHRTKRRALPVWGPWYRQAGDSFFIPDRRCKRGPAFGNPDTGRSGIPSLHRTDAASEVQPFGNPDTGRSGIPAFTPQAVPLSLASIKPRALGQVMRRLVLPPCVVFP